MTDALSPSKDQAELFGQLAKELQNQTGQAKRKTDAAEKQEADDRSRIVRWTLAAFGLYLAAIVLTLFAKAIIPGHWDEAVAVEIDVLKTIMPILTLVLGYYFSRTPR